MWFKEQDIPADRYRELDFENKCLKQEIEELQTEILKLMPGMMCGKCEFAHEVSRGSFACCIHHSTMVWPAIHGRFFACDVENRRGECLQARIDELKSQMQAMAQQ